MVQMGAAKPAKPSLVVAGPERTVGRLIPSSDGFSRHAGYACRAAGLIFLIGAMLDLVVLWGFQRGDGPGWEFTALASTIEGTPRLALGAALIAVGLYIRGSTSLLQYRLIGLVLVLTGIGGTIVGGMLLSDFFILRRNVEAAQLAMFNSVVFKALALSGLHAFVLIPLGVLSMRRPRS